MGIVLKSSAEIAKMRATGRIVRAVLDAIEAACVPGITTAELNRIAERALERAGARSAFLGYRPHGLPPYPAVLCTSRNEVVVHGIPREDEVLREGDLVGIDFACYKDGFCADSARTVAVGVISAPARALLETTRRSLEMAIAECRVGKLLGDLGASVQRCAEDAGFSVVTDFTGHGIGAAMHEAPEVPKSGRPGVGVRLRAGMVLAIEPMLNIGAPEVRVLDDGWTVVTGDGSLSAHVEHTVAITDAGPEILTA